MVFSAILFLLLRVNDVVEVVLVVSFLEAR